MNGVKTSQCQAWSSHPWPALMDFPARPIPILTQSPIDSSGARYASIQETDGEGLLGIPSINHFTRLLQECMQIRNLECAKCVLVQLSHYGLEAHNFLSNYLISLFVECGSLSNAHQAFQRLEEIDQYSLNSLMQGYISCEDPKFVFDVFDKMQEQFVIANKYILQSLLKACARLKCLERGQELHSEIIKAGLNTDHFVGSVLLDVYARCGCLTEAQAVFDKLLVRDVVACSALLAGYAEHGLEEEALICFKKMQLDGVTPNAVTYIYVLKSCGSIGDINSGQKFHNEVTKEGFDSDIFLGSALVGMYANCGCFLEAYEVLQKLPTRDVVVWTTMITGYAEHGLGKEALCCLEQMQLEGISATVVTCASGLKACGCIEAIDKGREIHAEISREGYETNIFISSALVDMYARCGLMAEASEVLNELPNRDQAAWNALISGYIDNKSGEEALSCLELMKMDGLFPDAITFVCTLKACGSVGCLEKGLELHAEIVREGYESNHFVSVSLVDMYAKLGWLVEAQELFDEIPDQDVVTWNALISGYAEFSQGNEAFRCLEEMQMKGVPLNDVTLGCGLKSCICIGALAKGQILHAEIIKLGFDKSLFVANALVDMYAKSSLLEEAQKVFDKLVIHDLIPWTALIAGYTSQGDSGAVFLQFDRMREEDIQPDGILFLSVLTACSYAGLVDMGLMYFVMMVKHHNIQPSIEHHNCLVDLLSRAGRLEETASLVKNMPVQPNHVAWSTLLAACQKRGDVELGRQIFECAARSDDNHEASTFVLMANIFADAGIWGEENLETMGDVELQESSLFCQPHFDGQCLHLQKR